MVLLIWVVFLVTVIILSLVLLPLCSLGLFQVLSVSDSLFSYFPEEGRNRERFRLLSI